MEQITRTISRREVVVGAASVHASGDVSASRGYSVITPEGARTGPGDVQHRLDTALMAEQLAATFYYKALTTPAVLRNSSLTGPSGDPNNPALPPGGDPSHVRYLQAALDAEVKHAALLSRAGAIARVRRFYFPPTTFRGLGTTLDRGSFLGVLEILETVLIGLYVTVATDFMRLERSDLALLAAELMGVEAEHRTLGRVIAGVHPPNNLTLEQAPYPLVDAVMTDLLPFLTGKRYLFAPDTTVSIPIPTHAQTARVIGKYGTRLVRRFV